MAKYASVRTDNMSGTTVGKDLVSLKADANVENGSVVVVGDLIEGEREVRAISDMTATSKLKDLALVASVEIVKSKNYNTLGEFVNEKDSIMRGYRLVTNDVFSITKEAFKPEGASSAKVGAFVVACAGRKMDVASAEAEGTTTIGKIIAIEGNWYVIEVA